MKKTITTKRNIKLYKTAHAVFNNKYHLVWIPKYRKPVINKRIQDRLKQLFLGIAERYDFEIDTMEVEPDHVHLFVLIPPTIAVCEAVNLFKGISSRKIRQDFPEIDKVLWGADFWAIGYFSTTVNDRTTSQLIRNYIKSQKGRSKQLRLF